MDTPQDTAPEQQQKPQGAEATDQALQPQDSPTAAPDSRQRDKKGMWRSRKPVAVQAAVFAQAALGASTREIARTQNMARDTVCRILSHADFCHLREQGKTALARAIRPAAKAVQRRVKKEAKDDKGIAMHSMFLLKATGVAAQEGGVTVIADNAAVIMGSVPAGWESQFAAPGDPAQQFEGQVIDAEVVKPSESAAD